MLFKLSALFAAVLLLGVSSGTVYFNGKGSGFQQSIRFYTGDRDWSNHYIELQCPDHKYGDCTSGGPTRHYVIKPIGWRCSWDARVLDCKR